MSVPRIVSLEDFPIRVTQEAQKQLRAALQSSDEHARLGLLGGGPPGFTYHVSIGKESDDDDQLADFAGLHIVIDTFSAGYMKGSTLDWIENEEGAGFLFTPPAPD